MQRVTPLADAIFCYYHGTRICELFAITAPPTSGAANVGGTRTMNPLDSLTGTVVTGLVLTVVMVLLIAAIAGGGM